MDQRLRELERRAAAGDPEASLELARRRYALGELRCGDQDYVEALEWAREQDGFSFLDVREYACGGQRNDVARFEHAASGLVFCLIPGGRFLMGSPAEEGKDNERPQHEVTLRPFLLCQTACTQGAYQRVAGENPAHNKDDPRLPAEGLSWEDAAIFCELAGLRLPSEAQWEYACRAGAQTRYCFGDDELALGDYAWWQQDGDREDVGGTRPTGTKLPNAFGLFDVHGNVYEWCQDAWHDDYRGAPTDGSAWEEPARAGASECWRVHRGGNWDDDASCCRAAQRFRWHPVTSHSGAGLRPARTPAP